MQNNILENLQEKKVMKWSIIAMVCVLMICVGVVRCSVSAMKSVGESVTLVQSDTCTVDNDVETAFDDRSSVKDEPQNFTIEKECKDTVTKKIIGDDGYVEICRAVESEDVDCIFMLLERNIDMYHVCSYYYNLGNKRVGDLLSFIREFKLDALKNKKGMSNFKSVYTLFVAAYDGNETEVGKLLRSIAFDLDVVDTTLILSKKVCTKYVYELVYESLMKVFCLQRGGKCDVEKGEIYFRGCRLYRNELEKIVDKLNYGTVFRLLDLGALYLSGSKLGHKEINVLSKALKANTTITDLRLYENQIGNKGAKQLSELLIVNTTITNLDLGENQIGDKGAIKLSEALVLNTALTELGLSRNWISDEGTTELSKALMSNTTLTVLDLGENQIEDGGVAKLSGALMINTTLTKLYLIGNWIKDKGAQKLSESLTVNTTLVELNLFNNQIRDEGVIKLSESLMVNTTLTKLDLSGNQLGVTGEKKLLEALMINTTMVELYL